MDPNTSPPHGTPPGTPAGARPTGGRPTGGRPGASPDETAVEAVLAAHAEAAAEGRPATLGELCGGSPALLAAAEARLAVIGSVRGVLDPDEDGHGDGHVNGPDSGPGGGPAAGSGVTVGPLGPYTLGRVIAAGGNGTVHEARRSDGMPGRFAVKLIDRGGFSPTARARFEAEWRALARLDHPAVVPVLDGGVTDRGVPYLVMPLIGGLTLGGYAHRGGPSGGPPPLRERLGVFAQAVAGVAHAHAKLVVHRDLKPSNIMVVTPDDSGHDGDGGGEHSRGERDAAGGPAVKVIDFGIARALGGPDAPGGRVTRSDEIIGTAAYMSPEQLGVVDADPDTRSDIFSLGVVLYELVTGWLPHQRERGESPGVFEMQRRLSGGSGVALRARLAAGRAGAPCARPLAGSGVNAKELDWVVARCLEPEPDRRYATAAELLAEIERLLAGQAVEAGPRSARYLARAFVRRHRAAVAASAAAAAAIAAAGVITAAGLVRAADDRARAAVAEATNQRLTEHATGLLGSMDQRALGLEMRDLLVEHSDDPPAVERALATTDLTAAASRMISRAILGRAVRDVEAVFADDPETRAGLLRTIGAQQLTHGDYDNAEALFRDVLRSAERSFGQKHGEAALTRGRLGQAILLAGRPDDAEPLLREALEQQADLFGPADIETLSTRSHLGMALFGVGKLDESVDMLRTAVDLSLGSPNADEETRAMVRTNLADVLDTIGLFDEAEPHHRAALASLHKAYGPGDPRTIVAMNNLGKWYGMQRRFEEAAEPFETARAHAERHLGSEHPLTLLIMNNYCSVLLNTRQFAAADELSRESVERHSAVLGPLHPQTVNTLGTRASVLVSIGRLDEALDASLLVVERATDVLGPMRIETAVHRMSLAATLARMGRWAESETEFEAIHELLTALVEPDHPHLIHNAMLAAGMYTLWDKAEPGQGHDASAEAWNALAAERGG